MLVQRGSPGQVVGLVHSQRRRSFKRSCCCHLAVVEHRDHLRDAQDHVRRMGRGALRGWNGRRHLLRGCGVCEGVRKGVQGRGDASCSSCTSRRVGLPGVQLVEELLLDVQGLKAQRAELISREEGLLHPHRS